MSIFVRYDFASRSEILGSWCRDDFQIEVGDQLVKAEQAHFAEFLLDVNVRPPAAPAG
jgi:hypothetical protein